MDPLIGEIKMFAGTFAPLGWAFCDGQLLPINQHTALFSILGTTYGGDGRSTFALPDLRGRVPMHEGQGVGLQNRRLGEVGGQESVALGFANMPEGKYSGDLSDFKGQIAFSTEEGTTNIPSAKNVFAKGVVTKGRQDVGIAKTYRLPSDSDQIKEITMSGSFTVEFGGAGVAHNNMQPYLALNYIIALDGVFPARS